MRRCTGRCERAENRRRRRNEAGRNGSGARQGVVDEAGQPRNNAAPREASHHDGGEGAKAGRDEGHDAQGCFLLGSTGPI